LATQDLKWLRESGWPVIRNIAEFWVSRASYNSDKKRYEITHVTSVEENYTDISNDTFTNASVRKVLEIASRVAVILKETPDPAWRSIAQGLYLPFSESEQHYLDFDESMPRGPPSLVWMISAKGVRAGGRCNWRGQRSTSLVAGVRFGIRGHFTNGGYTGLVQMLSALVTTKRISLVVWGMRA
jgi:hypothetical protein